MVQGRCHFLFTNFIREHFKGPAVSSVRLGCNIPVEVAEELLHRHLLRRVFVHVTDAAPGIDRGGDRGRGIVMISRTEDGRRHDDPVIENRGGVPLRPGVGRVGADEQAN